MKEPCRNGRKRGLFRRRARVRGFSCFPSPLPLPLPLPGSSWEGAGARARWWGRSRDGGEEADAGPGARTAAGLDASGELVVWHHRLAGDRVTPFSDIGLYELGGNKDFILMAGVELDSYDIPNQWTELLYRDTGTRTSPLRGVGFAASTFVAETFLDEIAQKRGIDPVQFRLELLRNSPDGQKVVQSVATMADCGRSREGRALGFAFVNMVGGLAAGIAEVSLDRRTGQITVHDFWCAADCGVQIQPDNMVAQIEGGIVYGLSLATFGRITIKDGSV